MRILDIAHGGGRGEREPVLTVIRICSHPRVKRGRKCGNKSRLVAPLEGLKKFLFGHGKSLIDALLEWMGILKAIRMVIHTVHIG